MVVVVGEAVDVAEVAFDDVVGKFLVGVVLEKEFFQHHLSLIGW